MNIGNNKGNPYHSENGQFTSKGNEGRSQQPKSIEPNGDRSFKVGAIPPKKTPIAAAGGSKPPRPGNPYHNPNESGQFSPAHNDVDIINKSLKNLINYAKKIGIENTVPNSEWADDLYYQLKNDGVEDSEAQRLSRLFANTSEFKHPSDTIIGGNSSNPGNPYHDDSKGQFVEEDSKLSNGFKEKMSKFGFGE